MYPLFLIEVNYWLLCHTDAVKTKERLSNFRGGKFHRMPFLALYQVQLGTQVEPKILRKLPE
jgi:hypothetical protein